MSSNPSDKQARSGHRSLRQYLARRRDRAHDQAQLDIDTHEHPVIGEHPMVCADEPAIISTTEALGELCEQLKQAGTFAYDTEFIGETSYHPQLCLIQVATAERLVLIDPLISASTAASVGNDETSVASAGGTAGLELEPLWRLLADESVCKIVHAGQPDLTPVVRRLQLPPRNIFDTQIAAGFVGLTYPASLHDLIAHYMQVKLPKAMTFTRWDHRPLSAHHLRYAVDDVRYLPAIHQAITGELAARDRTSWAAEEFVSMENVQRYQFDADTTVQRILKTSHQPHQVKLLLKQYVKLRDRLAEKRDLPPRSILKDRALVDLARAMPRSEGEVLAVSTFPRHLLAGQAERFVKATEKVMESAAWSEPARRVRPLSRAQRAMLDEGWMRLKENCEAQQVALGLVASRKNFGDLAASVLRRKKLPEPAEKTGEKTLEDHALLSGWRRALVEPVIREMMGNER